MKGLRLSRSNNAWHSEKELMMRDDIQMLPEGFKFKPQPGMQQIKVDISKSPPRSCACGCKYFTPAVTVHTISALMSPTGQELMAQVPVLICLECKEPLSLENKS